MLHIWKKLRVWDKMELCTYSASSHCLAETSWSNYSITARHENSNSHKEQGKCVEKIEGLSWGVEPHPRDDLGKKIHFTRNPLMIRKEIYHLLHNERRTTQAKKRVGKWTDDDNPMWCLSLLSLVNAIRKSILRVKCFLMLSKDSVQRCLSFFPNPVWIVFHSMFHLFLENLF